MRLFVTTMALVVCGAGIASAQDDRERKMDELRRDMERTLEALQRKFASERERLEKEFKAARERLLEKKEEGPQDRKDEKPHDLDSLVRELLRRVDSLEKKLDGQLPKFHDLPRELPRLVPHDFDFKRLPDGLPEEWRHWLEQMPRFRGAEDFKFQFRRAEPKKDGDPNDDDRREKAKKKPKPGEDKDDDDRREKPKKKPKPDDSF